MSNETTKNDSRKKKIWTVVGVGALAVAVAGGGALSTLYTSIADNRFAAAVPEDTEEVPTEGALLRISGEPISYRFDSANFNDRVVGEWVLTNEGTMAAPFDGGFELREQVSAELARALDVEYGVVDGSGAVTRWVPAGTVADTASFAEVLGIDSIEGGQSIPVHVRVLLTDPSLIEGAGEVGDELEVRADFTVSYLDPLSR